MKKPKFNKLIKNQNNTLINWTLSFLNYSIFSHSKLNSYLPHTYSSHPSWSPNHNKNHINIYWFSWAGLFGVWGINSWVSIRILDFELKRIYFWVRVAFSGRILLVDSRFLSTLFFSIFIYELLLLCPAMEDFQRRSSIDRKTSSIDHPDD